MFIHTIQKLLLKEESPDRGSYFGMATLGINREWEWLTHGETLLVIRCAWEFMKPGIYEFTRLMEKNGNQLH